MTVIMLVGERACEPESWQSQRYCTIVWLAYAYAPASQYVVNAVHYSANSD